MDVKLPKGRFGAIYADPPWSFKVWSGKGKARSAENHYDTMSLDQICQLPVAKAAAEDCVLFMWAVMPQLPEALQVIESWGFKYKTCAFNWLKQNKSGVGLFTGMGYWTRANAEVCLLATRGKPKRINADVKQGILEPVRQHSRKPDCVYERIERLVGGPYLEMFARQSRPGWTAWGNETDKFSPIDVRADSTLSVDDDFQSLLGV